VNERFVLVEEAGIVTLAPRNIWSNGEALAPLPACWQARPNGPALGMSLHDEILLSEKESYRLLVLTLVSVLLGAVALWSYKKSYATALAQERHIKSRYHLPPTTMQLKGMLASLRKIEAKEMRLRRMLQEIEKRLRGSAVYFETLEIEGRKVRFVLRLPPKMNGKRLQSILNVPGWKLESIDIAGEKATVKGSL
jgi:hypothetical protein